MVKLLAKHLKFQTWQSCTSKNHDNSTVMVPAHW